MTSPPVVIDQTASIADAGKLLSNLGLHRLIVVDQAGTLVGMVSAVDILRGLLGLPASHPTAFPHYDDKTGLTWTDDTPLETDRLSVAPDGPGLLVLVHGGRGLPERVVWTESCVNVFNRLTDLLSRPQLDNAHLAKILELRPLRFRAAALGRVARPPHSRQRTGAEL
jgi:hypothetical protein